MRPDPTLRRALRAFAPALALSVAGLTVACADSPTGPAGPARPGALAADLSFKDAPYDADGDGKLDKAEKAAKKADDALTKAELDSLKADWKAYKDAVKHGAKAEFLRCEPQEAREARKVIGPKGGTLHVGPHTFEVPAGALDAEVEIRMKAPTRSVREVEFEPHGLRFRTPVTMTINYKGCVVPEGTEPGVVYAENGWNVLERMPVFVDAAKQEATALTDHFSGYLMSTGRTRAY